MVCISPELIAIIATTIVLGTITLVCDHLVRQELRELRASSNALRDAIDAFERGLGDEIMALGCRLRCEIRALSRSRGR
jgi:hypothetical protein